MLNTDRVDVIFATLEFLVHAVVLTSEASCPKMYNSSSYIGP